MQIFASLIHYSANWFIFLSIMTSGIVIIDNCFFEIEKISHRLALIVNLISFTLFSPHLLKKLWHSEIRYGRMRFVAQAWRNWQTRTVQVRVLARAWRFESSCLHHKQKTGFLPVFCLLLIPRGLEPTRVRVGLRIFFSSLAEQKMRQRSDQRERRSHRRWRCDFCAAKYFHFALPQCKTRQRSDSQERRSHRRWRCDFCAAKYFHFALPQCKTRQRSDSQERRSHRR